MHGYAQGVGSAHECRIRYPLLRPYGPCFWGFGAPGATLGPPDPGSVAEVEHVALQADEAQPKRVLAHVHEQLPPRVPEGRRVALAVCPESEPSAQHAMVDGPDHGSFEGCAGSPSEAFALGRVRPHATAFISVRAAGRALRIFPARSVWAMSVPAKRKGTKPARGYTWPPFQKGHTLRATHGARSLALVEPRALELVPG